MSKKHSHQPQHQILLAFLLNFGFSIYEFIGGSFTGSTAIMSDAVHDFGDAISIGLAYFFEKKSTKHPNEYYTYGYIRYSLVGGLLTTLILLIGSTFVIYNAVVHLLNPAPINYGGMTILAIIGVIVNLIATYITRDKNSLNQRSVNLHMLEDVLGWAVVLAGAIIMSLTDITYLDPILSILVALFILKHALVNLNEIFAVFLEKTPANISLAKIKKQLLEISTIKDIHHLHIWSLDGVHHCATLHVITPQPNAKLKHQISSILAKQQISHLTIEFEDLNEHCTTQKCQIS